MHNALVVIFKLPTLIMPALPVMPARTRKLLARLPARLAYLAVSRVLSGAPHVLFVPRERNRTQPAALWAPQFVMIARLAIIL